MQFHIPPYPTSAFVLEGKKILPLIARKYKNNLVTKQNKAVMAVE